MPRRWRQHEVKGARLTNKETGEVIEGDFSGLVPVQSRRSKSGRRVKFMLVDIEAMPRLQMSKGEWSLFWNVVMHTNPETGEARVATAELAENLGWLPANTSRSLGRLRDRNILLRERQGVWRVNPLLLSRKQVEAWRVDMDTAPRIDWDGDDR
jgi:hypothetical protein